MPENDVSIIIDIFVIDFPILSWTDSGHADSCIADMTKSKVKDKHVATPHGKKKCPHVAHFNVPRDWFETN